MYGKRQEFRIVWIPASDALPRLGQGGCVNAARNSCDRKRCGRKQNQIDRQSSLSGQPARVFLHLRQCGLSGQDFFDCLVAKHANCLASD